MYSVVFQANGTTVEISANAGENLLDVARKANVAIDAPCSGNGVCGKCRVRLTKGTLDSAQNRHLSDEEYQEGWRLACCSKICADVEIEVPDIASAYRSRMKIADLSSEREIRIFRDSWKEIRSAGIDFHPIFRAICVTLAEPTIDDAMPDNERLMRSIQAEIGCKRVVLPFHVLKTLADVLRDSGFSVRCVISENGDTATVLDIFPSTDSTPIAGLAVDLGTTTLAALLVDLETGTILAKGSGGNGQIRFGADVINRIIESSKPGGRKRLQDAVIEESIRPLIQEMCKSADLDPKHIYRMVLAGNTTMNHLLLGVNADPVRMEPFVPSFFLADDLFARDIGLHLNPEAELVLAPNIGS
mgnify:FL=1